MASVREARPEDIPELKDRLRQADVEEVWASGHYTPEAALRLSYLSSTMRYTVEHENRAVAMFGVAPVSLLSDKGSPWLLGSDDLLRIKIPFLRQSRDYVQEMLTVCPYLENYVDVRNTLSIVWLKWCGFKMEEAEAYGAEGKSFIRFWLVKKE